MSPTFSASRPESEEEKVDCSTLPHAYDVSDNKHIYLATDGEWDSCDQTPCPNTLANSISKLQNLYDNDSSILEFGRFIPVLPPLPPTPLPVLPATPSLSRTPGHSRPRSHVGRHSRPTSHISPVASPAPHGPSASPFIPVTSPRTISPTPNPVAIPRTSSPELQSPAPPIIMNNEQFAHLLEGLAAVTNALQTQATCSKDVISKPEAFKGKKGHNARQWLNQFDNWAQEQSDLVNNDPKKIRVALNLMTSKAGDWANQFLAKSNDPANAYPIFNGSWADFTTAFKGHFSSIDEEKQALADLKLLKQGWNESVSNYVQAFTELASLTKLLDYDQCQYFVDGLMLEMRKLVGLASVVATLEPKDLSKLIARANKLDISINNPALNIGRGGTQAQSSSGGGRDPNAMDVDTTRGCIQSHHCSSGAIRSVDRSSFRI